MINQLFMILFAIIAVVSCGGSGKEEAMPNQQQDENDNEAEFIGDDGMVNYRPDTAKVYYNNPIDKSKAFIVISKKELRLFVYADINGDTTLIAHYPVCLSRNKGQKEKRGDMKTPESVPGSSFKIKQIQDASTWTHDFGDGRGAILSYGHWFMRLETPFSGIGIHGSTNNENKMPGRDSEGCIRLRDRDLDHLHDNYAIVGMPVTIKGEKQGKLPFEKKAQKSTGQLIR